MFYLVRLDRDADGNLVETPLPDYGTFAKGADAAKAAKAAASSGVKAQCRRIAQAGDWRGDMAKRLFSGELMPLPEKWDLEPIKDHFAHLATIDRSKIGYIDTEEHGIINKATVLTPGRYISRFYPEIDDDKRRHLIAAIDPSGEIYFAWTPEEIEDVYKDGPSSCMDGEHDFGDLPCWPTDPYGAGDLAVAFTRNKDGDIQSRAVCWPEKKIFGRIYGDYQRMKAAMEAEGYTWMREQNDVGGNKKKQVFIGAKLLKIPADRGYDHEYVMPYFDDIKVAIDMGDHFLTAEQGELGKTWIASGSSDDGVATLQRMCPKRNVAVKVTEMRFVHGVDEEWSQDAIRYDSFVCGGSGKIWPHEYKVIMGGGVSWSKEHFAEHGEFCEVTKKNWPKKDMVQLGDKRMHSSVSCRFDDQGNELAIQPKPTMKWGDRSLWETERYMRPMSREAFTREFQQQFVVTADDLHAPLPSDRVDAVDLALRSSRTRRRVA